MRHQECFYIRGIFTCLLRCAHGFLISQSSIQCEAGQWSPDWSEAVCLPVLTALVTGGARDLSTELFDPSTSYPCPHEIQGTPDLRRFHTATATADNQVILCGGYYTPRDCVTLDTDRGTWSNQKLELEHGRNQHLALETPEGLLLMGGQKQGHSQEILHLDPKTKVGLMLPRLPQEIVNSCAGK